MSTEGSGTEDLLLERLKQSASGDAAVRQLRRRYDLLRHDYELLIDRLGELEERLAGSPGLPGEAGPAPDAPAERRATGPAEQGEPTLSEGLVAPLLKLRDEYLTAASALQSIVQGLDGLAAAAFKGQRASAPAAIEEEQVRAERPRLKPTRIQVDVKGGGFGELLDFQEQIAGLPGVARVSINAIDNERATLVVQLEGPPAQS